MGVVEAVEAVGVGFWGFAQAEAVMTVVFVEEINQMICSIMIAYNFLEYL